MGEEKLKEKIEEAHMWYEERVQSIKDREAKLATAKEAFIPEKAAAEMAQEESDKKTATLNSKLTQRKV